MNNLKKIQNETEKSFEEDKNEVDSTVYEKIMHLADEKYADSIPLF